MRTRAAIIDKTSNAIEMDGTTGAHPLANANDAVDFTLRQCETQPRHHPQMPFVPNATGTPQRPLSATNMQQQPRPSSAGVRLPPLRGHNWDAWIESASQSLADRLHKERKCHVRVFLSSPFSGMEGERELFTRRYLPQLRHLTARAGLHFTALDLRWGVTETSSNEAETLRICLRELDISDIFVGFYGSRYGWHHRPDACKRDALLDRNFDLICNEFPWTQPLRETASATHLEFTSAMQHAGDPLRRLPAMFFFRDAAWDERTATTCAQADRFKYAAESDFASSRLSSLKENVLKHPDCHVTEDYADPADGAARMFSAIRDLLDLTLRKLKDLALSARGDGASNDDETPSHDAFALSRQLLSTGMSAYMEHIERHFGIRAEGDERDGERDSGMMSSSPYVALTGTILTPTTATTATSTPPAAAAPSVPTRGDDATSATPTPLIVCAESGMGKSSLLAKFALGMGSREGVRVFYHAIGCTEPSTRPENILQRLCKFLTAIVNSSDSEKANNDENKSNDNSNTVVRSEKQPERAAFSEDLRLKAVGALLKSIKSQGIVVYVVIDGLDQVASVHGNEERLSWLPFQWWSARVLLSVAADTRAHVVVGKRCYNTLAMQRWDTAQVETFVGSSLKSTGKQLSQTQRSRIVTAEQCTLPLFLSLLMDELVSTGTYETIDTQIDALVACKNATDLFEAIVRRLVADFSMEKRSRDASDADAPHPGEESSGEVPMTPEDRSDHAVAGSNPVAVVLTAIAASRIGLSESELSSMFDFGVGWLSPVLYALRSHLVSSSGLFVFNHQQLRRAVMRMYMPAHYEAATNDTARTGGAQQGSQERTSEPMTLVPAFLPFAKTVVESIVGYFTGALATGSIPTKRIADELVWALASLGEDRVPSLRTVLLDLRVLTLLRDTDMLYVVRAWTALGPEVMATAYREALVRDGDSVADCYYTAMVAQGFHIPKDQVWASDSTARNAFVVSAMYMLVGKAVVSVGSSDAALPFLQHALALREKYLGDASPYLATACQMLAACHLRTASPSSTAHASALAGRAMSVAEIYFGKESAELIPFLVLLANVRRIEGRLDDAICALERGMDLLQQSAYGVSRSEMAMSQLGMELMWMYLQVRSVQGKIDDAVAMAVDILAGMESMFGSDSPYIASYLQSTASLLVSAEAFDRALPYAIRAVDISRRNSLVDTALHVRTLGTVYAGLRQIDRALEQFHDALRMYESIYGPGCKEGIQVVNDIASCLMTHRRLDEAEEWVLRAVKMSVQAFGETHISTLYAKRIQASWCMRVGKPDDAVAVLTEVAAEFASTYGKKHPFGVGVLAELAVATVAAKGGSTESVEMAKAAYDAAVEALGPTSKEALGGLYALGEAHLGNGDAHAAARAFQRIVECNTAFGSTSAMAQVLMRLCEAQLNRACGNEALVAIENVHAIQSSFATPVFEECTVAASRCAALLQCAKPLDVIACASKVISTVNVTGGLDCLGRQTFSFAWIMALRATALCDIGEYADAMADCNAVLSLPEKRLSDMVVSHLLAVTAAMRAAVGLGECECALRAANVALRLLRSGFNKGIHSAVAHAAIGETLARVAVREADRRVTDITEHQQQQQQHQHQHQQQHQQQERQLSSQDAAPIIPQSCLFEETSENTFRECVGSPSAAASEARKQLALAVDILTTDARMDRDGPCCMLLRNHVSALLALTDALECAVGTSGRNGPSDAIGTEGDDLTVLPSVVQAGVAALEKVLSLGAAAHCGRDEYATSSLRLTMATALCYVRTAGVEVCGRVIRSAWTCVGNTASKEGTHSTLPLCCGECVCLPISRESDISCACFVVGWGHALAQQSYLARLTLMGATSTSTRTARVAADRLLAF